MLTERMIFKLIIAGLSLSLVWSMYLIYKYVQIIKTMDTLLTRTIRVLEVAFAGVGFCMLTPKAKEAMMEDKLKYGKYCAVAEEVERQLSEIHEEGDYLRMLLELDGIKPKQKSTLPPFPKDIVP